MKKSTSALLTIAGILFGIVVGFLASPVKHGIGNNSGNYYGKPCDNNEPHMCCDDDEEEKYYEDEDDIKF